MISSVNFNDAGVYTCTNERLSVQFSQGGPATVNVTIAMDINNNCTYVCDYIHTYGVCMFGVYIAMCFYLCV